MDTVKTPTANIPFPKLVTRRTTMEPSVKSLGEELAKVGTVDTKGRRIPPPPRNNPPDRRASAGIGKGSVKKTKKGDIPPPPPKKDPLAIVGGKHYLRDRRISV